MRKRTWPLVALVVMTFLLLAGSLVAVVRNERARDRNLARETTKVAELVKTNRALTEEAQRRDGQRAAVIDDAIRRILERVEQGNREHEQRLAADLATANRRLAQLLERRLPAGPPGPSGRAGRPGPPAAPPRAAEPPPGGRTCILGICL